MAQWTKVKFDEPLFANAPEALISRAVVAAENVWMNAAEGWSKFPGLLPFVSLPGTRTYVRAHRGHLYAVTDQGRIYRLRADGHAIDITKVQLSGGRRPIFDATEDELVVAAGGPILRIASDKTETLSDEAPESTHVAFISGYLIAIEPRSGRFFHSLVGQYTRWEPIDVFTAEGKPDDLTAAIVTPYLDLLLCGPDSIEQFQTAASGTRPFVRRSTAGAGLSEPYTLVSIKSGTYGVDEDHAFGRFALQTSRAQSDAVAVVLERVDDWREAWADRLQIRGEEFIVLQAPHASNPYGTQGLTLLLDYRRERWSMLYGWDDALGVPTRWPGWSFAEIWGRRFVGVSGGVAEMRADATDLLGQPMRALVRTGHIDEWGPSRLDGLRARFIRGGAAAGTKIGLRVNRDNRGWDRTLWKDMGTIGDRDPIVHWPYTLGNAETWQFEFVHDGNGPFEFVAAEVNVERLRRA